MKSYEIGMRIKKQLANQNKKQKDLAEYLDVSKQVMSNTLRGANNISVERLTKISIYLCITVDELLDKKEKLTPRKFASLEISEMRSYIFPNELDSYGKCVIDYLYESKDIDKFLYLFNNEFFQDDQFNRTKICSFAIRNNLLSFLLTRKKVEQEYLINKGKEIKYIPLFPKIVKRNSRLLDAYINKQEHNIYDLARMDYIEAILNCSDTKILNLIPDHYKEQRRRGRTFLAIDKTLMNIAIIKNNSFIYKYFLERYKIKPSIHHLKTAEKFDSDDVKEYINNSSDFITEELRS